MATENSKLVMARQLAGKARIWMATPEGMRRIQEADKRVMEEMKDLQRARFVSPVALFEPVTI